MTISFNPATYDGQFSALTSLAQNALKELGESSPSALVTAQSARLIQCANSVVRDVNSHPYFMDILTRNYFADFTGSMTSGSPILSAISSNPGLVRGTPLMIAGAGYGGAGVLGSSDLYTTVVAPGDANSEVRLMHAALTTVSGATVSTPYKAAINRYIDVNTIRPIDDLVMVKGIKAYWTLDESYQSNQTALERYDGDYGRALGTWLAEMLGYYGALYVEVRD